MGLYQLIGQLDYTRSLAERTKLPPAWDRNPNLGGYASYPCLCA